MAHRCLMQRIVSKNARTFSTCISNEEIESYKKLEKMVKENNALLTHTLESYKISTDIVFPYVFATCFTTVVTIGACCTIGFMADVGKGFKRE